MSAVFKIGKDMQEMTDLSKALDTKLESRSALALAVFVCTSLLRVDLLLSRDFLKNCVWQDEVK